MPVTISLFFDRLRASELLDAEECRTLLQKIPADKRMLPAERIVPKMIDAGKLTSYQAAALLEGNSDPLLLGDYIILERIGSGGMGQVFKAEHRRMKRTVALKVLPTEAVKSPDAVKRFQREVQAAARLLHPNIVTAFDAGEAEGVHFLVMEYVDGPDLAEISKSRGPLPVDEVVEHLLQAARGLAYAHAKGVVHRDIKPANLLVNSDGTVKILDMGLARVEAAAGIANRGAQEQLTQSGQVMGTLDFMAPEQAFDTRSADARADIYSLGCTLYRLLIAETLFGGESLVQIILAHREQPIPSLRSKRADVPAALDALFQKMIAKKPEDRPASMAEVVSVLETLQRGAAPPSAPNPPEPDDQLNDFFQGIAARPRPSPREVKGGSSVRAAVGLQPATAGSTSKMGKGSGDTNPKAPLVPPLAPSLVPPAPTPANEEPDAEEADEADEADPQPAWKSRKLALIGGIAVGSVLLLVLGAVAFAMWNRGDEPVKKKDDTSDVTVKPKGKTPVTPPSKRTNEKNPPKVAPVPKAKPGVLPAGQPADKILGLLAEPPQIPGITRWQIESVAPRSPLGVVAWAPDNRRVAVAGDGKDVRVYDTTSWRLQYVLLGHTGVVRAVAWSADGTRIASAGDDKTVRLWRSDGTPGPILPGFTKPAALAFSPDSQWLAVGDADAKSPKLQLWKADCTPGPTFAGHTAGIHGVAWHPDGKQFASCGSDKVVRIWNVDESPGSELKEADAALRSISWGKSGEIAAVDSAGNVYIYPANGGQPHLVTRAKPRTIAWNPEGTQLAVGMNNAIQIWDATGDTMLQQQATANGMQNIAWSADGKRVAWAGPSAGVWEVGGATSTLSAASPATSLDYHPDGSRFVSVHADGRLRWWRRDGTAEETSPLGSSPLVSAAWSPTGQHVAALGGQRVFLWTADRTVQPSFELAKRTVACLAWNAAGQELLIGGDDPTPRTWSVTGTSGLELKGHDKPITAVAWSRATGAMATASSDGTVRLWGPDGAPGPALSFGSAKTAVYAIAWNADGQQLAVATGTNKDPRVRLFDASGMPGVEINSASDVRALAFSPDGQHLACADRGGNVRTFSMAGQPELVLAGHLGEVKSVSWTKAGQIVSGGDDRTLRAWDAATGLPLWVAVSITGDDSVSLGADGKPLGSLITAEKSLVYLIERAGGRIEVLNPLQFGQL